MESAKSRKNLGCPGPGLGSNQASPEWKTEALLPTELAPWDVKYILNCEKAILCEAAASFCLPPRPACCIFQTQPGRFQTKRCPRVYYAVLRIPGVTIQTHKGDLSGCPFKRFISQITGARFCEIVYCWPGRLHLKQKWEFKFAAFECLTVVSVRIIRKSALPWSVLYAINLPTFLSNLWSQLYAKLKTAVAISFKIFACFYIPVDCTIRIPNYGTYWCSLTPASSEDTLAAVNADHSPISSVEFKTNLSHPVCFILDSFTFLQRTTRRH
jgi:hypothetical protein